MNGMDLFNITPYKSSYEPHLYLGNCLDVMKTLPSNSIDAIITDPPYGLSFMNSKWDYDVPSTEIWAEAFRIAKPGAHLLSFFGTRTYHRGAVKIEDAGFDITDQIGWCYATGYPKSMSASKAIDKHLNVTQEVVGSQTKARSTSGASALPTLDGETEYKTWDVTVATSPEAKEWDGWGTALKPAWEPICLARKPIPTTVAENLLTHGVGALNIDECRIPSEDWTPETVISKYTGSNVGKDVSVTNSFGVGDVKFNNLSTLKGRWPANFIHDGSPEVTNLLPNDSQRFFYCAKASQSEKNKGFNIIEKKNIHPTVKPIALMRYLCKLITPPNGMILDPFMGSGSTGVAAKLEKFQFTGIELSPEFFEIAKNRINHEEP